jgi:hypothetical protein
MQTIAGIGARIISSGAGCLIVAVSCVFIASLHVLAIFSDIFGLICIP